MKKKKGSLSNVEFILMLVVALLIVNGCFEAEVIDRVDDGEWQCFNWTEKSPDTTLCFQQVTDTGVHIYSVPCYGDYLHNDFSCNMSGIPKQDVGYFDGTYNLETGEVDLYGFEHVDCPSTIKPAPTTRTCTQEAYVRPPK